MPRINPVLADDTTPKARALLEGVSKTLGMTPNVIATMAHSPAVLQAYLSFGQALSGAELGPAIREQIAVAVAGENRCGYCASAHTQLGLNAGVSDDELARNLRGESNDADTQAAIDFARAIVTNKGWISDTDLESIRAAGFSDRAIVEIVATVAINIFTNYLNHIADTEIDFPLVEIREDAAK